MNKRSLLVVHVATCKPLRKSKKSIRESDMLAVTEWMALQQGRTVGLDETMVCLKDVSLSV